MAWPFTSVAAPNVDSGLVAVPTALTLVPSVTNAATPVWLMGASFANGTNDDIFITLQDGSGAVIASHLLVGPNDIVTLEWPFMPATGLQWQASAAGVTGKIWGYE